MKEFFLSVFLLKLKKVQRNSLGICSGNESFPLISGGVGVSKKKKE